jgi:hypothetical protein
VSGERFHRAGFGGRLDVARSGGLRSSWRQGFVSSCALVLVAFAASGCGERERTSAVRSEGATQQPRSIGLGVRDAWSATPPRTRRAGRLASPRLRCLGSASWSASANRSYAALVRTAATAYAQPGESSIVGHFDRLDLNGFPSVFGVLGARVDGSCSPAWYRVQLPIAPNGTTAWVRASAVSIYAVTSRIVVDLSARRLVAYRGGRVVLRAPVAIGASQTPTPTGRFFVDERFVLSDPNGPFGVAALGISAHSTVLHDWVQGGPIALHGTNESATIGDAVSHGCIRLANDEMRRLLAVAPAGTPVLIRQ